MVRFVNIESPYKGKNETEMRRNLLYARFCVRDCLLRGEIPLASHLFFTQPGMVDDRIRLEIKRANDAEKILIESLPNVSTVVYSDLGITSRMKKRIGEAKQRGRNIEYRVLERDWEKKALRLAEEHPYAEVWGLNSKRLFDINSIY